MPRPLLPLSGIGSVAVDRAAGGAGAVTFEAKDLLYSEPGIGQVKRPINW